VKDTGKRDSVEIQEKSRSSPGEKTRGARKQSQGERPPLDKENALSAGLDPGTVN
jgi:hypothetical protein